ncbi:DM13 domain-containing protein [Labrenzia sp. PHM005]|uniref:DM13 domain-containing protein n=1 Tax=Labrenzia sp. PHM005 TaxID=2590016 RepID=UPI001140306A|nr:DM13 domain-containing protein [Labrenzia sp. PHM005]QDG78567.1 DM13 domain-containing protein [Labrenzia sp. PHM005]
MLRRLALIISHGAMLAIGFALGIYLLPILTEPEGPGQAALVEASKSAVYSAELTRDLKGSDFLHWGEGKISLSSGQIVHEGSLAPGPDYKLYLVKEFVEDEAQFLNVKKSSVRIGDVKTFNGFILDIPDNIKLEEYTTVLVWCEAFGEFITAAKYR